MAAFDSGAFHSGAFDAAGAPPADIAAKLTRHTAEALGNLGFGPTRVRRAVLEVTGGYTGPTQVRRVTAEVLATMPILRAQLVRYVAEVLGEVPPDLTTRASRIVAEVLYENPPPDRTSAVTRYIAEVLQEVGFAPPVVSASLDRVVAEVLGIAAEHAGRHTTLSRVVAEAITSLRKRLTGLILTGIEVQEPYLLVAATIDTSVAGYWGLQDAQGQGFSVRWGPSSPGTVQLAYEAPGASASATVSVGSGPVVLQFPVAPGASTLELTDLGITRPDGFNSSAVIHEVMLFNSAPATELQLQYANYLTRKWVSGLANPGTPCDSP